MFLRRYKINPKKRTQSYKNFLPLYSRMNSFFNVEKIMILRFKTEWTLFLGNVHYKVIFTECKIRKFFDQNSFLPWKWIGLSSKINWKSYVRRKSSNTIFFHVWKFLFKKHFFFHRNVVQVSHREKFL